MALAIIFSFLTGITIVVSRTINAKLAMESSYMVATFYNYVVGLLVALFVLFCIGRGEFPVVFQSDLKLSWIYLGGVVGVVVVTLSNIVVAKISSFYMSLLTFVGQVFTGLLLDFFIEKSFSTGTLVGCIFVTAGLTINIYVDYRDALKSEV